MMYALIALPILAVAALVIVMLRRRMKPHPTFAGADTYRKLMGVDTADTKSAGDPEAHVLRQNLRVKLLYQEDKIDAVIEFERERDPSASTNQLMRAAIARWERDNR